MYVKMDSSGSLGIDKSIRLRIEVDIRKPLMQRIKVKMRGGEEDFYEVKYERPPLFCYHCGMSRACLKKSYGVQGGR